MFQRSLNWLELFQCLKKGSHVNLNNYIIPFPFKPALNKLLEKLTLNRLFDQLERRHPIGSKRFSLTSFNWPFHVQYWFCAKGNGLEDRKVQFLWSVFRLRQSSWHCKHDVLLTKRDFCGIRGVKINLFFIFHIWIIKKNS